MSTEAHIGSYRLERPLGEGASAQVFVAIEETSGRRVALKVLRAERGTSDAARLRFHREARALFSIEHPNVMTVYDYSGPDATTPYLASELLVGDALEALVDGRGPVR